MNSYNKTQWVNGQAPAISAENLNHIEEGIRAATDAIIAMDNKNGGKMNIQHATDSEIDSADQYNTVYAHIVTGVGFKGLVLFAGYDNYAASYATPVTQYRFTKSKGFEYRVGTALGGHQYSWDKAWNEDWNQYAKKSELPTAAELAPDMYDELELDTYALLQTEGTEPEYRNNIRQGQYYYTSDKKKIGIKISEASQSTEGLEVVETYSDTEIDAMIGDIGTALDTLNNNLAEV